MENKKNNKLILSCLLGGFFLIISFLLGNFIFFDYPFDMGSPLIGEKRNSNFSKILFIFGYFTLYGGILIIIGLLIIYCEYYRFGTFLITLGAVISFIGLVVSLSVAIFIEILFSKFLIILITFIVLFGGFGVTGLIITIIVRLKLSKILV